MAETRMFNDHMTFISLRHRTGRTLSAGVALIIVASDENDAIQMRNHALLMRSMTESRPCALVN
jgi:hypothetical protein